MKYNLSLLAILAVLIAGCGNDSTTAPDDSSSASSSAGQIAASYEDLSLCTASSVSSCENDAGITSSSGNQNGWYDFGLGPCSAANQGEIKQVADSSSIFAGIYLECDTAFGNWRSATVTEYDTYQWTAGSDAAIRKGDVSNAKYKYDEIKGRWLDANRWDTAYGLNGCTQKREAEVARGNDSIYYICKSSYWIEAKKLEYDTYPNSCTETDVGTIVNGAVPEEDLCGGAYAETRYYCGTNGWISLAGVNWDVPKEARLNPNILYETMTDDRDGQTYKTVAIGSQTWMAENLNYDYKVAGVSYGNQCYIDSARYCSVKGCLYTWGAAMDSVITGCGYGVDCAADTGKVQGVCPNGWHLPDSTEWEILFAAVGGQTTAGTALKASSGWPCGADGSDAFGFSALPAGFRLPTGSYLGSQGVASMWSYSNVGNAYANCMLLLTSESLSERASFGRGMFGDDYGMLLSVRCVKD